MVREVSVRSHVASAILTGAVVLAPVVAGCAPALSKSPFTITNDPVHDTVVDTMLQRTCTGTLVPIWWSHLPHLWIRAIFYREPDGTKWVNFYWHGKGPEHLPVTELGVSAQWITPVEPFGAQQKYRAHFAAWPDGDNRLSGTTVDPYGTIDLTCE